jgi:D-3-phosphoglycerate dehydrogenase
MKILIGIEQGSMPLDVSMWESLAQVEYVSSQDEDTLIKQIVDAEVLIPGWRVPITAKIITAGNKLKMIQTFSVGYDKIDHIAAIENGIMVCNTGGSNAESVAELTWGLILGLCRQIPGGDRLMKAGQWGRFKADKQTLIWGKTLGIVGFGTIGRLVSKIGRLAFNMNLLAYDPYVTPETVELFGGQLVSLERVMKESDVVSIHVPLSNATRHMISMRELQMMHSNAILVNTARGAVIDETALIKCLQEEVIAGAALDVFEVEPLPVDSPLRSMDNVIIVAHIGTCPEVFIKMRKAGIENVTRYLRGEKPMRIVNPSYIIKYKS